MLIVRPMQEITTKSGATRKKSAKTDIEQIPLIQRFFATWSAKQVTIRFNNSYFGIKKDNGLEKFMNTVTKDAKNVGLILDFIKTLFKSNISASDIATHLNDTQTPANYSQSILQYLNAINKPVTIAKIITPENKPT